MWLAISKALLVTPVTLEPTDEIKCKHFTLSIVTHFHQPI